jgi:hypothetical protein
MSHSYLKAKVPGNNIRPRRALEPEHVWVGSSIYHPGYKLFSARSNDHLLSKYEFLRSH